MTTTIIPPFAALPSTTSTPPRRFIAVSSAATASSTTAITMIVAVLSASTVAFVVVVGPSFVVVDVAVILAAPLRGPPSPLARVPVTRTTATDGRSAGHAVRNEGLQDTGPQEEATRSPASRSVLDLLLPHSTCNNTYQRRFMGPRSSAKLT